MTRYMTEREIDDAVDKILGEPLPERPVENPNRLGSSVRLLIKRMPHAPDHAIARELNVRDPDRVRRARELLGSPCTPAEPAARNSADADSWEGY